MLSSCPTAPPTNNKCGLSLRDEGNWKKYKSRGYYVVNYTAFDGEELWAIVS